jgi:hypothetical protein
MPNVEWGRPVKDERVKKTPGFRPVLTETEGGYIVDIVVDSSTDTDFNNDALLLRQVHQLSVNANGELMDHVVVYKFSGGNTYVSHLDPPNEAALNPDAHSRATEFTATRSGDLDVFWIEAGFDRTNP